MKPMNVSFELTMGGELDKLEVDLKDVVVVKTDKPLPPHTRAEFENRIKSLLGIDQPIMIKTKEKEEDFELEDQTYLF